MCAMLHNFLERRNVAFDADVDLDAQEKESNSTMADWDESVYSAGAQRRIELVKALGLRWVDTD